MNNSVFNLIVAISALSIVLPLFFYLSKFREHPRQNHYLGVFLITSFVVDVTSWLLQVNRQPTMLWNNLFFILAFILISGFYYEVVFKKRAKYVVPVGSLVFTVAFVYCIWTVGMLSVMTGLWLATGLILGTYSILYLCIVPSMIIDRFLDRFLYSNVIINTSISFYFFTTIVLFAFSDFVFAQLTANEARIFWSIHDLVNIAKNIGLATGLYFTGKRQTYITLEQLEKMSKPDVIAEHIKD